MSAAPSLHDQARHCMARHQWGAAIALWQQVLQDEPQDAASALALSTCLRHIGLLDEAVVMARNALQVTDAPAGVTVSPAEDLPARTRLQLAHLYAAQGRHDSAGAAYTQLLSHAALGIEAAIGLSRVWLREGYPSRALEALAPWVGSIHEAPPEFAQALATAHYEAGDARAALDVLLPRDGALPTPATLSNALMFSSYLDDHHAHERRLGPLVAQVFAAAVARAPISAPTSHAPEPAEPRRRLRVGWVSADFNAHPVGYFLAAFLPHLREHGVDSVLYANSAQRDAWTERLTLAADDMVRIEGLPTDEACARIAQDRLDVLVDLSGHTRGHRLDLFAQRACRVQASYLGYFSSTFVPAMDWLITDRLHVPPEAATLGSERLTYLPQSRFCWAPPPDAPLPADPPCLRNGYITWGAFTNLAKISDTCLAQWSQVLREVPDSRMQLRWKSLLDARVCEALRARFARHGIAPGRIELYGASRHADMMAAYQMVDLVLDTFPFSGATTSCEALWMGVPVLTRVADRPAGRQTASLLQALGETDWIAYDEAQFVANARACAQDTDALTRTRAGLRQKMMKTSLLDGAVFARDMAQVLWDLAGSDPSHQRLASVS
jgi:predicted O-linked N-acetylglucosamine transferase (SPINDLY family)